MPVVRVEGVHKRFGAVEVLKGIDLTVESGEVVAIIGRSGSGKSTLLRCINGLEQVQSGRIEVAGHRLEAGGRALRALRKDVGIVFQSYNLFPHLRVGENIMLAPRVALGIGKAEAAARAREVLAEAGYSAAEIDRSLAMRPKVMLFDEVTSALDPELTGEVLATMERLAQQGMTMLLVTHEMAFAARVATRTVFMHEGRIWESGPSARLFGAPETAELRQFLGTGLK